MNERNLEFYVPDGAQIIDGSATATTEAASPLNSAPVPEGEKNRYSFIFPLRPGIDALSKSLTKCLTAAAPILIPKSLYPLEHFVVMVPKTMQFASAATAAGFKLINYPNEPDASVQVASNTKPGQNLAFKISGEGVLESRQEGDGSGARRNPLRAQAKAHPHKPVPAADLARLSMLPTRCRNIAGGFSAALPQLWFSAEFT